MVADIVYNREALGFLIDDAVDNENEAGCIGLHVSYIYIYAWVISRRGCVTTGRELSAAVAFHGQ